MKSNREDKISNVVAISGICIAIFATLVLSNKVIYNTKSDEPIQNNNITDNSSIRRCPFCYEYPELKEISKLYIFECSCGLKTDYFDSKDELYNYWNGNESGHLSAYYKAHHSDDYDEDDKHGVVNYNDANIDTIIDNVGDNTQDINDLYSRLKYLYEKEGYDWSDYE